MRVSNPFFKSNKGGAFVEDDKSRTYPTAQKKTVAANPWLIDLAGYWKADDNLLDSSGNARHLSRVTMFSPPAAAYAPGKLGDAYDFDGTSGYGHGRTVADSVFDLSGDFTMSFWVNFNDVAPPFSNNAILSKFDLGAGYPNWSGWLVYADNNASGILLRDGINTVGTYLNVFSTSTWYHIVICRTGSDVWIYLDGVGQLINTYPAPFTTNSQPLYVGMGVSGGAPLNGLLDEVAIWTRALSVAEIGDLYNGGSGLSLT